MQVVRREEAPMKPAANDNLALKDENPWWVEDQPTSEGNWSVCWGIKDQGISFQVAVVVTKEIAEDIVEGHNGKATD